MSPESPTQGSDVGANHMRCLTVMLFLNFSISAPSISIHKAYLSRARNDKAECKINSEMS